MFSLAQVCALFVVTLSSAVCSLVQVCPSGHDIIPGTAAEPDEDKTPSGDLFFEQLQDQQEESWVLIQDHYFLLGCAFWPSSKRWSHSIYYYSFGKEIRELIFIIILVLRNQRRWRKKVSMGALTEVISCEICTSVQPKSLNKMYIWKAKQDIQFVVAAHSNFLIFWLYLGLHQFTNGYLFTLTKILVLRF